MVTGEAGAPIRVAWSLGRCACLFLTQLKTAQSRVVGTQRVQLTSELSAPLTVSSFV